VLIVLCNEAWGCLITDAVVEGVDNSTQSVAADGKTASLSSPLMHIEGLLEALTVADKDGRVVVDRRGKPQTRNML